MPFNLELQVEYELPTYGKNGIRVLRMRREAITDHVHDSTHGHKHHDREEITYVQEVTVDIRLNLASQDAAPPDVVNPIYTIAKENGVSYDSYVTVDEQNNVQIPLALSFRNSYSLLHFPSCEKQPVNITLSCHLLTYWTYCNVGLRGGRGGSCC